ncbi:unnamed protein product [Urochloa humidicola]
MTSLPPVSPVYGFQEQPWRNQIPVTLRAPFQGVSSDATVVISHMSGSNTPDVLDDGYNWRRNPINYYKCSFPNCPVWKIVERSLEGHIIETVYKGKHKHYPPSVVAEPGRGELAQSASTSTTAQLLQSGGRESSENSEVGVSSPLAGYSEFEEHEKDSKRF